MSKTPFLVGVLVMLVALISLGCQPAANLPENKDVLYQYSTLGSLMAGVYDGNITYAELKQHGDFGVGTFNTLDGEMLELDHQVYQIKSDGVAYPVADQQKAPFAVVTYFAADQTVKLPEPMACIQLKTYVDSLLPTQNIPYAIKITGTFDRVQTRSVPKQDKPYPLLSDVVKTQPTFEFLNVDGVMLGFRLPSYMATANAPGYHFHFITADRSGGGHLLECQVRSATIELDYTDEWHIELPSDAAFYQVDMSTEAYR